VKVILHGAATSVTCFSLFSPSKYVTVDSEPSDSTSYVTVPPAVVVGAVSDSWVGGAACMGLDGGAAGVDPVVPDLSFLPLTVPTMMISKTTAPAIHGQRRFFFAGAEVGESVGAAGLQVLPSH
jgi:hypothetical protein